jgi:hypothetical protein
MTMRIFAQLRKVDLETRRVWGRATQEVPDRANEIFDYESSKPNFAKWSADIAKATEAAGQEVSLGNIREMHGKVAAGKVVEIDFNDAEKAIDIVTEIVDDAAWDKVKKGVYTGFSIGGKYVKKWKDESVATLTRFTADPVEISLVDLACVPSATFSMVKAAGVAEDVPFERYGLLKADVAREDLTVGELLTLVKDYLPPDRQQELMKADTTAGGFLAELRALVAEPVSDALAKDAPKDAAAASAKAESSTESSAEKAAGAPALVKSMYTVGAFADMLQTIAWMAQDAEWEKGWEKDASTIPDELRAWLALGTEIFKKMSAEETAELVASLMPPAPVVVDVVELGAADEMAKAGKRHSKADQDKVQAVHDHAVGLGAMCDGAAKSAAGDLATLDDAQLSTLGKAVSLATGTESTVTAVDAAEIDAIATFAIAKAAEVVALAEKVKALEALPVEAKGVLRLVGKSDDVTELGKLDAPILPDPTNPKEVMKAVHATGGMRLF